MKTWNLKEDKFIQGFVLGILFGLVAIILSSCSGGGGGGSSSGGGQSSGVPYIQLSLDSTNVKRGQTVFGTVSWNDTDGDITTLLVEEYFGPIRWNYNYLASQLGIRGKAGSTRFYITTKNDATPGIHIIKFYFRDARGQQSNIIEINMNVYAMDNAKETEIKTNLFQSISN